MTSPVAHTEHQLRITTSPAPPFAEGTADAPSSPQHVSLPMPSTIQFALENTLDSLSLEEFSLIQADVYSTNSTLDQKTELIQSVTLLQTLLTDFPDEPELTSIKEKLECLLSWEERVKKIQSERDINRVASEICFAIKSLSKGASITLPGGYEGNALIYEITKTDDDTFDFQIINTGEGVEYHHNDSKGLKTKTTPHFTLSNITLEELIGTEEKPKTDLFVTLLLFQLGSKELGKLGAEQVYASVAGYFSDKHISTKPLSEADFITPARSENSSWKTLMALMRQTMSKDHYKKMVFLIKKNTLAFFFRKNEVLLKADSIQGRQARELITLIAKKLSIRTAKIAHDGLGSLTLEEIKATQDLAASILEKIDEYKKAIYIASSASIEPLDITQVVKPPLKPTDWTPSISSASKHRSVIHSAPPLDFTDRSFLENLDTSQKVFLNDYSGSFSKQRQLIIDFVRKVPKPWNQKDYAIFSHKIPTEEIPQVLTKLYHYFNAYIHLSKAHGFKAGIDKITIFSLYALILDLSLLVEARKEIPEIDKLSNLFGANLDSEDLIEAGNLMLSPYDREEWESIRSYFKEKAPDPIIYEASYYLKTKEYIEKENAINDREPNKQTNLLYYFHAFTERHLEELSKIQPSWEQFDFTKEVFIGAWSYRTYDPSVGSYCQTFDQIGFGHLPILSTSTMFLHHLFSKSQIKPEIYINNSPSDDFSISTVSLYECKEFETFDRRTGKIVLHEGLYYFERNRKTIYNQYRKEPFKELAQGLRQRKLLDIDDSEPEVQSQAEAALVDDPNLDTDKAKATLAEVLRDLKSTRGYQIIKSEGDKAIAEAKANLKATTAEMPYLIAHAATHNSLRPIELLGLALDNIQEFESESVRKDFLQQFFKLSLHSSKSSSQSFNLIEDPHFQRAFIDFLSRYKDSTLEFSTFTFGMKIGVLLLPHVTQDSFKTAICRELEAIQAALHTRKKTKELYSLHLLLAIKEAFAFQKLFSPKPTSSASSLGSMPSDTIDPELQKCFNSLIRHWMFIKTTPDKEPQLEDSDQTLEDLIYPIFGLPIAEKLIDDEAIKKIVKEITGFEIPKDLRSRPLVFNPIARMFEDEDKTCVDLLDGKITTKRDAITLVEFDEVYYLPSFTNVFGKRKDFKFSRTGKWYHFNDPMQGSFRVQTSPVFLLERLIGSDWARLHHDSEQRELNGSEPSAIQEFKKQIQSHCQILTTDYFCYEGAGGYYFIAKGHDKNAYFIPRDSSLTIEKIDIETQEVLSEIIPITFLSEGFQTIISRFESPSLVYLEKKSDESIKLVFPRHKSSSNSDTPLTFILSGEDWLLESNQSKRLSANFVAKLIDDFESFLVLENIATKKLSALIPQAPYEAHFPSFASGAKLDFAISNPALHTQRVNYDEIPFDGELFQPSTPEHRLRLFYLAAGQAKFETALAYLKQLSPSDLQTPSQRQIGGNYLKYLSEKELTPLSIALQMQLGYLLFYYEFIKGTNQAENEYINSALYKICSLYNSYCNRLGHIPTSFRLSFEKERLILQKAPILSSAMKARIACCPELKPDEKIPSIRTSQSSPIHLSVHSELVEYLTIPKDVKDLEILERQARDALHDLNPLTLLNLVKTNPYIYDLVYDARKNKKNKEDLHTLLYLASCLISKSDFREYSLIHKLLVMVNDSKGPPPLRDLHLTKTSLDDRPGKIHTWRDSVCVYLNQLNNPKKFQLPQKPLEQAPTLYPHLEVLGPPNSILVKESPPLSSTGAGSNGVSSSQERSTPPKVQLSWTGRVYESRGLRAFASIKEQIKQNLISFNYGSICDRQSIVKLEELALAESDPLLKGAFKEAFENFIRGFDSIEDDERLIPAVNTPQLEAMERELNESIDETELLVKTQLEELLKLANTPSEDEHLAKVTSGFLIGGVFREVTIEQLRLLFLSSDKEAFEKACPQLSKQAIQTLYNMIGEYLYLSIHLQQMNRLREAMIALKDELISSSVQDALAPDGKMLKPEIVSKALALKVIAGQGIKDTPSPQHLLFQYSSHMFRKRPDQQRVIEELEAPTDKVAQVLMGGGKTTVFAANLLAKACSEGKIAILITPNFQYEAVYKTIQGTLQRIFGIEVVTFHYKKEELNIKTLEALELSLLRIKHSAAHHESKVLLLRPETLQLLTLEWLHTLNQIKGETSHSDEVPIKWKTLTNILKLLKDDGYSLGDEVHILLDIIKEIHIPIGQRHSVDEENISLVRDIFKIINNIDIPLTRSKKEELEKELSPLKESPLKFTATPDGNFKINIDQFLKLKENKQSYCSTKIYKDTILPAIAACLALTNHESLMLDPNQQRSFCRYVQGDIKADVQKALINGDISGLNELDSKDLKFLQHLSKLHNSSNEREKKAADLIALSKYIISDLLPILLSKTGNIHFGRTRDQKTPGEVVPYLCANTPSGNKFGNHYEAIVYHFMSALIFGVEDEQIKQLFRSWDAKARGLSQSALTYEETPTAALSKHLFGILPCQLDEIGNFEKVRSLVKSDAPGFINRLFAIEENTIEECVTYQKESISAHAHMLADLCSQFQGLSGTFHLEELFLKLQANPELDVTVNPLCIRAFLEKPSKVLISHETSPKLFIDENFNKLSGPEKAQACALLDAGGVFKDFENKAVAKALLQKLEAEGRSDIKAVLFFARLNGSISADYPVLLRVNSDEVEPLNGTSIEELSSKGLKAGDYAVYLDSHHCTGTDIPFSPNALGFLTYDPSIGLDTTTQAMMRFRNYLINQSLVVVVPEYSCSLLPKTDRTIEEFVRDENQLEAKKILVAQMIIKQVEQGSGKMIKAFRKMLEYAVFQKAKDLLLCTEDLDTTQKIASGFKSSLLHLSEDTPYLSFGSLSAEIDTIESLKNTSAKILSQLKQNLEASSFSAEDIKAIIETIEKEHRAILGKAEAIKPHFIAKVMELIAGKSLETEGTEREIAVSLENQDEVEQEVEQELEQEVEQEIEQEVFDEHNALQLRTIQEPNPLKGFTASSFLEQIASASPIHGSIEPIKNLFHWPALQKYAPLFEDSPLLITSHFKQPFKRVTNIFDASHAKARPFQYLLISKLEDGSYRAVIISGYEASKLVEHIRNSKPKDVWISSPSELLQAGDQSSWEECCQNEQIKKMMLIFNLLGGNAKYLFKNIDQYSQWHSRQNQILGQGGYLKTFLKLTSATHPINRNMILDLTDPETLTTRLSHLKQLQRVLAFDDIGSSVVNKFTASLLSPLQLQALSVEQLKSLAQYLSPDQISQLPGHCIKELPDKLLAYLTPSQARYLTSKEQIQSLSTAFIQRLTKEDLEGESEFLEHLTDAQYAFLTDPVLIDMVPEAKLGCINLEMIPHIGPKPARLRALLESNKIYYSHLSREQFEALAKESDAATLFEKIPLEAIKKLPLTESTKEGTLQECHGFLSCLSSDQIEQLTDEQIKKIKRGEDLARLRSHRWRFGNQNAIKDISISRIRKLSSSELKEELIDKFSEEQIHGLTKDQVLSLSDLNKCPYLSQEQLDWLPISQYEKITSEILIQKIPDSKLRYIKFEMTAKIGPDARRLQCLASSSDEVCLHFGHLSREQLEALSKQSDAATLFEKIPLDAIKNLSLTESTNEETLQECHGFISFLTKHQKAELTTEQVEKIKRGADLAKLNPLKWKHANVRAIQGLPPEQIKKIPVAGIGSVNMTEPSEQKGSDEEDISYLYEDEDEVYLQEDVVSPIGELQSLLTRLSEEQIQALTETQVQSITDPNQCPCLSEPQVALLTPAQCKKLTNEDLIKKVPDEKLVHIATIETPKIGANASRLRSLLVLGQEYCAHFGHLSRSQLEALSKEADATTLFKKIPIDSIETLDLTIDTDGCSSFIKYLTQQQRAKLSEKQVALIKDPHDLELLPSALWQHAIERVLQQLPVENIQSIPLKELTPLLLGKFSEEQVKALTEPQVKSLEDPNLCPYLNETQVSWLTDPQYKKLTNEALIQKVPEEKLVHIPIQQTPKIGPNASRLKKLVVSDQEFCPHFAYLSRSQLEVLAKQSDAATLFKKIPLDAIKTLDLTGATDGCDGFIPYLSDTQKEKLTPEQIGFIADPKQLELLISASWQYGTTTSVQELPIEKIQAMLPEEITPLLLGKLSIEQVQALTEPQVQSIQDPNMCLSLTETQVGILTEDQYRKLNNRWLIEKVPDEKLAFIDPTMTKHIGLDYNRLRKLGLSALGKYSQHFAYLSRGQLELILKNRNLRDQNQGQQVIRYELLRNFSLDFRIEEASNRDENLAHKISPEDISRLPVTDTPCLIKYLKPEQIGKLTPEQIAKIEELEDLLLLPPELWQHGRDFLLIQLTLDQIQKIPSSGITDRLLKKITPEQAENFTKKQIQGIENPNECVRLPATQLLWITESQRVKLTTAIREQMGRIIQAAANCFKVPEIPEIKPVNRDFRSIGSGFLPSDARSTRDLWIELERKTANLANDELAGPCLSYHLFQAFSENELATLWGRVFHRPDSIIIDLTTNPQSDSFSYYPTEGSPWMYHPSMKKSKKGGAATEEDYHPFSTSCTEESLTESDQQDLEETLETAEIQYATKISEKMDWIGTVVELHKKDPITDLITYRIQIISYKTFIDSSGQNKNIPQESLKQQKETTVTSDVRQYRYSNWPVHGQITIQKLHKLIEKIEKFVAKIIAEKKELQKLGLLPVFEEEPSSSLNPAFWIREDKEVGSADTLIVAIALKQKFDTTLITKDNFDKIIQEIILGFRKEKGPEFLKSQEQLDLLRRYAIALITKKPKVSSFTQETASESTASLTLLEQENGAPASSSARETTRTEDLAQIQNRLWGNLFTETSKIDYSSWQYSASYQRYWPKVLQGLESAKDLTAHRIGASISERYLVACKAPIKADWALFWKAILKGNETSIVDLTENDKYAGSQGVYYPINQTESMICDSIILECTGKFGNLSTYRVTDTSIDPPVTQTIKRYHYREWNDDSPITLANLKELIHEVEKLAPNQKNPLWIHCFFGLGRTGTLITALVLKEKILKKEITKENLEKTLVDIIANFRTERALDFVRTADQMGLLYQYGKSLLEESSDRLEVTAASKAESFFTFTTLPRDFIRERGAGGNCAALSLLDQLQQRGVKKPDGQDYSSQQEIRNITSAYIRANIDLIARANICDNTTPEALLISTVVESLKTAIADGIKVDRSIQEILQPEAMAVLSLNQKKAILSHYADLIDKDGFWLDKGFFPFASAALGKQIVILRREEMPSTDLRIAERFPQESINPNQALFIYYNGTLAKKGNHYQSIQDKCVEKLTSLIEKDMNASLTDFIKVMREQKEKHSRLSEQTAPRAEEHKQEIISAVDRNLIDLFQRNFPGYTAICTLLTEKLGRDITLTRPLPEDVLDTIFRLKEEEIRAEIRS